MQGTPAFGMNYQHIYPCIPLHPLVRERLKAATCIQKINCQITLLLQPAATVTQKITKAPSFIVIFNSHRKKKKKITAVSLLIFKFQALHPKLSYLKLCSSLSIHPAKRSAAPDNVFNILCNPQIPSDSNTAQPSLAQEEMLQQHHMRNEYFFI